MLGGQDAGRRGGSLNGYKVMALVAKGLFDYFFPPGQMKHCTFGMFFDVLVPNLLVHFFVRSDGNFSVHLVCMVKALKNVLLRSIPV